MNVLIIDDSEYKVNALTSVLKETLPNAAIEVARSFHSALDSLFSMAFDLVILDMTLPTSERSDGLLEGRLRYFGGREILEEISCEGLDAKVIVMTQFDFFGSYPNVVDRGTLFNDLKQRFGDYYIGGFLYSVTDLSWRNSLVELLKREFM